jgi:hypothetical protein
MARAAGVSPASVQRLWAASDIKPHLSRTFKLSNDKRFEEKFWDVIGLYLNPPDKALVLCCDEAVREFGRTEAGGNSTQHDPQQERCGEAAGDLADDVADRLGGGDRADGEHTNGHGRVHVPPDTLP